MIQNFRHKGLKHLFEDGDRKGIRPDLLDRVENVLFVLNRAATPDMPGFRLHPLKGNLKTFWSVTLSANSRIIFRMEGGHATEVDLIDYH